MQLEISPSRVLVLDWCKWWKCCPIVQVLEVRQTGSLWRRYSMELFQVSSWQGWDGCSPLLPYDCCSWSWGKNSDVWFLILIMLCSCCFLWLIISKLSIDAIIAFFISHYFSQCDIKKLLGVSWVPRSVAFNRIIVKEYHRLAICVLAGRKKKNKLAIGFWCGSKTS